MSLNPAFKDIDPSKLGVRCKHCGHYFAIGLMLEKHADRQKDMPPGRIYIQCPVCNVTEPGGLQDPRIPTF